MTTFGEFCFLYSFILITQLESSRKLTPPHIPPPSVDACTLWPVLDAPGCPHWMSPLHVLPDPLVGASRSPSQNFPLPIRNHANNFDFATKESFIDFKMGAIQLVACMDMSNT